MKNFYLSVLLLTVAFTGLQAQKSDPEAKKVLDAVSAKFKTYKAVQVGFLYSIEDAKGKVQAKKTGTLLMKGAKYKVTFGDQEIYSDGKTTWNYDKGAKEVTVNNVSSDANAFTPQKLFTSFYDKDFLYVLNGEKKVGAKTLQEIQLTPTDKSKAFHKVYLTIDKNAKTIQSTKILENGGNKINYSLNNMVTTVNPADASFVFDVKKYPGVEVVDLR